MAWVQKCVNNCLTFALCDCLFFAATTYLRCSWLETQVLASHACCSDSLTTSFRRISSRLSESTSRSELSTRTTKSANSKFGTQLDRNDSRLSPRRTTREPTESLWSTTSRTATHSTPCTLGCPRLKSSRRTTSHASSLATRPTWSTNERFPSRRVKRWPTTTAFASLKLRRKSAKMSTKPSSSWREKSRLMWRSTSLADRPRIPSAEPQNSMLDPSRSPLKRAVAAERSSNTRRNYCPSVKEEKHLSRMFRSYLFDVSTLPPKTAWVIKKRCSNRLLMINLLS